MGGASPHGGGGEGGRGSTPLRRSSSSTLDSTCPLPAQKRFPNQSDPSVRPPGGRLLCRSNCKLPPSRACSLLGVSVHTGRSLIRRGVAPRAAGVVGRGGEGAGGGGLRQEKDDPASALSVGCAEAEGMRERLGGVRPTSLIIIANPIACGARPT